jgi:hypothetical protein
MTNREVMQQALEALETKGEHHPRVYAAINALRTALEKPEQEPVAWKWRVKNFCDWPDWSVSLKRPADSGHAQYPRTEGYEDIPLYTTPPQRPWQGLTEFQFAEIYNKWNDTNGSTPWGLNQALEAKLRKLNK